MLDQVCTKNVSNITHMIYFILFKKALIKRDRNQDVQIMLIYLNFKYFFFPKNMSGTMRTHIFLFDIILFSNIKITLVWF